MLVELIRCEWVTSSYFEKDEERREAYERD
jgi:hypothetical protein